MSEHIIYIDHSVIRKGKLTEVRAGIAELVEFTERQEPQLIAYSFYINEDDSRLTVVAVHPDAASMELHLQVGAPIFQKFSDLIELEAIEVYGSPSAKVLEQLRQKTEMLGASSTLKVQEQDAGFVRFSSVDI
jgi:hypothetical protein